MTNHKYWDINSLYSWAKSQKLLVNGFEWVEDIYELVESYIKSYNEESNEEYFLEVDVIFLKNYMTFIMIYHFYLKE